MPPRPGAQPPPNQGPPPTNGITMLGAHKTGKTTFLAALQIALLRRADLGWSLTGDNPGSTQALVNFMTDMTDNHIFPRPTGAIENYRWSLEAELPRRGPREWRRWGFRRRDLQVQIPLDLMDAPGEAADGSQMYGRAMSDQLVANLASSVGIVLFYDPVTEFDRGDAFRHTYGMLAQLRSQAQRRGKLPHYVAVCITKFDEIRVFESAQKLRMLEYEPEGEEFPRVPEEHAEDFFHRLVRLSRSDNAGLILPTLQQTFREDRVRFFVTSAIGFYLDPTIGVFDPDDYQNHIPGEVNRIRGPIYPINVIEPVLWLGKNAARAAG
jgi:hypothetical protein